MKKTGYKTRRFAALETTWSRERYLDSGTSNFEGLQGEGHHSFPLNQNVLKQKKVGAQAQ